jgi:hypothetical protein
MIFTWEGVRRSQSTILDKRPMLRTLEANLVERIAYSN